MTMRWQSQFCVYRYVFRRLFLTYAYVMLLLLLLGSFCRRQQRQQRQRQRQSDERTNEANARVHALSL